ncbi:ABC transporter permease [Thermoanaerobacter siderophilus]|uniref:ABC-type nitrate/sulfonate/bicarbonate transport system, permease component n=1 Tax=Thermoanaerobacter siderophilus SR4 TaxID=880478 RepID=I9KUU5_9THEO|nr:ABC transporter permease [Thermoanaerobacter siderophilus]EIW00651.1 ABC-type nitrate/sulfonate/bicarbonate transport system, permease component [Thermoanaerobacter siderophilus SR4]
MYEAATPYISKEHREFLKKVKRKNVLIRVTQFALLILFFATWEIVARYKIVDPFLVSQPSRMLKTMMTLSQNGSLFMHIWVTLSETIIGFTLGTIIGMIIAILLWWSDFLSKVAEPYLVVLNSLPKIALGPIFIVWMGNGEAPIITMALAISLIVTIISLQTGFKEVDEEKIKLLKTFGATKMQILTKCILPASVPTIISAIKINIGLSWVGVITGEFLVSKAGLGYLIVYGGQIFKLDLVMTSVLILSILSALMYIFIVYLEKKLIRWR